MHTNTVFGDLNTQIINALEFYIIRLNMLLVYLVLTFNVAYVHPYQTNPSYNYFLEIFAPNGRVKTKIERVQPNGLQ